MTPSRPIPLVPIVLVFSVGCAAKATPAPAPTPPPVPASVTAPAGVHHPLDRGQTLYALSRAYGVSVDRLMTVNGITDPTTIPSGTPIFVPGATHLIPIHPASARLIWPLAGAITSGYGPRGRGGRHGGIDIDADHGDVIRAAAAGLVAAAGRDGDYGLRVILDHGDGLTTLYAHASGLKVKTGEIVAAGDPIARVGRSGNARGSHLHFEVRLGDRRVDPVPYLTAPPEDRASAR